MDLDKQKLLRNGCQSNVGEAEDMISELPDSLLHHILSFLDIKPVARTCLLSKRWKQIWLSIPILEFPSCHEGSDVDKFMEFVDRTLHLHDTSSDIQKFVLETDESLSASRVHSWIENLTKRNVKELNLSLDQEKPFYIPISLFTCESLITLELSASLSSGTFQLPKTLFLPKLKNLTLRALEFTDDSWNEQHISNCPVLENLFLYYCTWFNMKSFCISSTSLKRLEINHDNVLNENDGLQDCALIINAPNLVFLTYRAGVAKEFVLSRFQTLEFAKVGFSNGYDDEPTGQNIGAAVCKFFQALAYVPSLSIRAETLRATSMADDFVNILPTFRNLEELFLEVLGYTTDKSVFPFLTAAPNLSHLVFTTHIEENAEEDNLDSLMSTTGCLFQNLRSVCFMRFNGNTRVMRWLKLILRNAKALQVVTVGRYVSAEKKQVLMSEFPSLPKASDRCVLEFS